MNDVSWLVQENGLSFGAHGAILSSSPSTGQTSATTLRAVSRSGWIPPIGYFYDPGTHKQFSLHQSLTNLELRSNGRATSDKTNRVGAFHLHLCNVFRQGKLVFITITSDSNQARVYTDSAPVPVGPQIPAFRRSRRAGQKLACEER